ncbi:Phosphatidylinositol-glycan biosynthesis class X protein [Linum grandiflorum]
MGVLRRFFFLCITVIALCDNCYSSEGYILESYFRKHQVLHDSSFHDHINDELSTFSCKTLPGEPHLQFLLSGLERHVIGEGSHRRLSSMIQLQVLPEPQTCKLVMIERLPSGVFADPFELDHLLHRGAYARVAVFGDTNLELPSVSSNRSAVEIHMDLKHGISSGAGIKVDLPLHARYPPLHESGFSRVTFGTPDLLVSCNVKGSSETMGCLLAPNHNSDKLKTDAEWEIPCGIKSHRDMVTVVTFATAIVSTLVIVLASVFHSELRP